MKTMTNQKTYVIEIPNCDESLARHDFQSWEWQSTNKITEAWQTEAISEQQAVEKFHKAFNIALTDYFHAQLIKN